MERLAARRLCIFNTNFLFLLRNSKVSCNFILKISKKFSAFKFSPKLWDKPARTALGPFLRLWSTQTFSALGSSMTSFALVIWAYEQSGSALSTALLSICSYAPYVLLSIFAGALSDRWNKKATMLICDAAAALTTVGVLVLLSTDALCVRCVGAVLGWLPIPLMNANLDVLFRTHIPVKMQGRVYAARNSLQFFTIPLGYLLGGALVDTVFEPFMAVLQTPESLFCCLFGTGKGSGAAFLFLVLGFLGVAVCLCFRRSKLIRGLEVNDKD